MIEELASKAMSEYGLFLATLLFAVFVLYKRNIQLADKILVVIADNTRVLTELTEMIRGKHDNK
jgi:hypothetical protein